MTDSTELIKQLTKRLQILEDKDHLTALLNTYHWTADNHDWEGYAKSWLDDAVLTFDDWGVVNGKEDIVKSARATDAYEGMQHIITNMKFEVDGSDRATGSANLWFCVTPEVKIPEVNYAFGGRYTYEFLRTKQGWKIAKSHMAKLWSQGMDTKGAFSHS